MDTKKFLLSVLAGVVTLFVLGGLIYGLALGSFVLENTPFMSTEPTLWSMVLSQLVMGGFIAYIYGKWASISTFAGGAKAGALIGLFLGVGLGFDLYSMTSMTLTFVLVDTVLWAIRFAIAGGAVGYVLGMGSRE
ncbi:MAG: hypothetical protein E2O85_01040 [Bacteroidetes bacterium]|nr:MAG: hypothetical protein E2O85_01040 [Bacteroidota bacterium]